MRRHNSARRSALGSGRALQPITEEPEAADDGSVPPNSGFGLARGADASDSVIVAVRVRPMTRSEAARGATCVVAMREPGTVVVVDPSALRASLVLEEAPTPEGPAARPTRALGHLALPLAPPIIFINFFNWCGALRSKSAQLKLHGGADGCMSAEEAQHQRRQGRSTTMENTIEQLAAHYRLPSLSLRRALLLPLLHERRSTSWRHGARHDSPKGLAALSGMHPRLLTSDGLHPAGINSWNGRQSCGASTDGAPLHWCLPA